MEVYPKLKEKNLSIATMFMVIDLKICSIKIETISVEECDALIEAFIELNDLLLPHFNFFAEDLSASQTGPFELKYLQLCKKNNVPNIEIINKVKNGRTNTYYSLYPHLKELMQELIPQGYE
jgi:hypothetical protein